MKIVVYGISCAGKDTFITEFVKRFTTFSHIKGSKKLNEISEKKYGFPFREIDSIKQDNIRKEFIMELKNYDRIIVDGHYCFPENGTYRIAFTEYDINLYDVFFYLRVNPSEAKKRISISEKNAIYNHLTEKDIENWQLKEISSLRDICFNRHKEFIVLDESFEDDFKFLNKYFSQIPNMKAIEVARGIVEKIEKSNPENNKIALFDCDRTVLKEDTTIPFFELNNSSSQKLKQIFYGDVYSVYQFWRQVQIYSDFTVYPDITKFNQNQLVIEKLNALKAEGYSVYGITSGIYKLWNAINKKYRFFSEIIGNDIAVDTCGIITDFVKGYVVKLLQEKGYSVFAVGDSMCDIYMLEACGGYIWVPEKTRPSVQSYINEHRQTSIKQFKNNPIKYIGIMEAE